eukprot:5052334-Pyramimonas_sp.AAC.1
MEPLPSVSAQFWSQVRALEALAPPEALDPSDAVEAVALSRWIDRLRRLRELTAESLQRCCEEAEAKGKRAAVVAANAARSRWKAPQGTDEGHPAATPSELLEGEGEAWHQIRSTHSRPEALSALASWRRAALQSEPMAPITAGQVRAALRSVPDRRGRGFDGLPPRLVKDGIPECFAALAAILTDMESQAAVPFQELLNMICLLDKEDGGLRPIALLNFCYVLLCRIRKPMIGAWDKASHGPRGKTVGGSAEHAGWTDELEGAIGLSGWV